MNQKRTIHALKVVLWWAALSPALWLAAGMFRGSLGPNPIETLTHVTGMTTLVLLLVTLTVTPVRRLTGWNPVIRLRRPLGLFAFFYAVLHFSIWFVFDMVFNWRWMVEDVAERPYITVGFTAFLVLIPLALTSTKGWIRRLGKKWTTLHRGIYLAATLGVVHFYWLVKEDTRLPVLLGVCLAVLLSLRVYGPAARGRTGARKARELPAGSTGDPGGVTARKRAGGAPTVAAAASTAEAVNE